MLVAIPAALGSAALADEAYVISGDHEVQILDVFKECDVCPEMVLLPMGRFVMLSSESEASEALERLKVMYLRDKFDGLEPETPNHEVTVDLPIAIGRNEVTRQEWKACEREGGCSKGLVDIPRGLWIECLNSANCALTPDDHLRFHLPKGPHQWHPNSPIRMVTYLDMLDYVAWLNRHVGEKVYRLPTEAEWEYAARAGTTTRYAQGETLTRKQANFMIFWVEIKDGKHQFHYDPTNERMPIPVDQLDAANAWGLRHMSGNVAELTSSCWSKRQLTLSTTSQYLAASVRPFGCRRVYKGGSWFNNIEFLRLAKRLAVDETGNHAWLGFRVVRDMHASTSPER